MADHSFTQFMPGFDFLQGLVKGAGAALPGVGQWVAPTLNPEELAKRIDELRTVQFWLEQNARMLGATIQALEVQKMTLATLKSMNVPLAQLSEALQAPAAAAPAPNVPSAPAPTAPASPTAAGGEAAAPAAAAAAVDPLQWWGALSQQFAHLASAAVADTTAAAASSAAPASAAKPAPARKRKA